MEPLAHPRRCACHAVPPRLLHTALTPAPPSRCRHRRGGGHALQGGAGPGGGLCFPSHDGRSFHSEQHQLCGEAPLVGRWRVAASWLLASSQACLGLPLAVHAGLGPPAGTAPARPEGPTSPFCMPPRVRTCAHAQMHQLRPYNQAVLDATQAAARGITIAVFLSIGIANYAVFGTKLQASLGGCAQCEPLCSGGAAGGTGEEWTALHQFRSPSPCACHAPPRPHQRHLKCANPRSSPAMCAARRAPQLLGARPAPPAAGPRRAGAGGRRQAALPGEWPAHAARLPVPLPGGPGGGGGVGRRWRYRAGRGFGARGGMLSRRVANRRWQPHCGRSRPPTLRRPCLPPSHPPTCPPAAQHVGSAAAPVAGAAHERPALVCGHQHRVAGRCAAAHEQGGKRSSQALPVWQRQFAARQPHQSEPACQPKIKRPSGNPPGGRLRGGGGAGSVHLEAAQAAGRYRG